MVQRGPGGPSPSPDYPSTTSLPSDSGELALLLRVAIARKAGRHRIKSARRTMRLLARTATARGTAAAKAFTEALAHHLLTTTPTVPQDNPTTATTTPLGPPYGGGFPKQRQKQEFDSLCQMLHQINERLSHLEASTPPTSYTKRAAPPSNSAPPTPPTPPAQTHQRHHRPTSPPLPPPSGMVSRCSSTLRRAG